MHFHLTVYGQGMGAAACAAVGHHGVGGQRPTEGCAEEACRHDGDAASLLLAKQGRPKELTAPG